MLVTLFSDITTDEYIKGKKEELLRRIDDFTNEEIMANNLEILSENLYQEFFVQTVEIYEEDLSKRNIIQKKVKKYIDPFTNGYTEKKYVYVDGIIVEFHFPYDGDEALFGCKASTFTLNNYPQIEIIDGEIIIQISKSIDEFKHISKEKMYTDIIGTIDKIKREIAYVNDDINRFNSELKLLAWKKLNEKKTKVNTYFEVAKMFEVPIEKQEYAKTHIPIRRKIMPISHEYDRENYFDIKDEDYKDILESIKHTISTYERTPRSYKGMEEEDLRNTLLATLNATYKGNATGETFRNNGKTDICIELDNRAAFVAECKMWTGPKNIEDAILQLDSYLTWRDCKTALIYFVRRKDFIKILDKVKETLKEIKNVKNIKEVDKNEFDCVFISNSNLGQQIRIRVMLFNIYSE